MGETAAVLWEGLVLEAFCLDEFSLPRYIKLEMERLLRILW